jgi:hypothetical protein
MSSPKQSLSKAIARIPDQVFTHGVSSTLPTVRFKSDGALLSELTLAQLHDRTQPSMLGRNDETVLDTRLRSSRETADIDVEFAELGSLLAATATAMNLPVEHLEAHVAKLLLYRTGDFFCRHQDAEHRPCHFLSMAIDLGSDAVGGTVLFLRAPRPPLSKGKGAREDDDEVVEQPFVLGSWQSTTRHWAAWFASTHHSVEPLVSGHRIVLTFDVTMTVPPTLGRLCPAVQHSGQLPFPQLVWEEISEKLEIRDCARLASVSRALRAMLGGVPRLLSKALRGIDVSALSARGFSSIGFVARHAYLIDNDDDDETVHPMLLKGRDRLLCEALRQTGWKMRVQRAVLVEEVAPTICFKVPRIKRVRVASGVLAGDDLLDLLEADEDDFSPLTDAIAPADPNIERVRFSDWDWEHASTSRLFETTSDYDGIGANMPFWSVPFAGVLFLETIQSLHCASYCAVHANGTTTPGEEDELWGNQAHFGFKSYRNVVMIADVIDPHSLQELHFGPDFEPGEEPDLAI